MIHVVCGLIGAGKSTFCEGKSGIVIDFRDDENSEALNKEDQIRLTLEAHAAGSDVWHVTCYPTAAEIQAFSDVDKEYIWINTTAAQALKNIRKRGRKRDILNYSDTLKRQNEILASYLSSEIRFRVIDIFETDERW